MAASSATRRSRISGDARHRLPERIVRPELVLALLLTAVAVYAMPYATGMVGFFVQPDELTYVREAMHFAETGRPTLPNDFWFSSYAQLFGLLAAPGFALWDTPAAFDYAHAVQVVAFASAAVPVYLLTRRLTDGRWAAVLAAAITILVPWLAMTGSMMSEPVAYAAFPWALLAMQVCLERGGVRGDLIGLAGILLAFVSRTQMVLLVGVLPLAILLHEVGFALSRPESSRVRGAFTAIVDAVRRHLLLVGAGAAVGLALRLGVTSFDFLGAYSVTADRELLPEGSLAAARDMFVYTGVGVGVLPMALAPAWGLLTLARPTGKAQHAFASLAMVLVPMICFVAATFVLNFAPTIQDRYTMYVAPVLAIGAALCLVDRRPSPVALLAGVAFAALVVAQTSFAPTAVSMPSPARTTQVVLEGRFQQFGKIFGVPDLDPSTGMAALLVLVGMGIALARLRRLRPAVVAGVVGTGLVALGAAQTAYTLQQFARFQQGVSEQYVAGRDWVDRAVGDAKVTAFVGLVFDPASTAQVWWESTFFNKSTDRIYFLPGEVNGYGQNFSRTSRVLPDGRVVDAAQRPYVLMSETEGRLGLRGRRNVQAWNGLMLQRVETPYRAIWHVGGTDSEGKIPVRKSATLRVFADGSPGPRDVTVTLMTSITAQRPYAARVIGAGRAVTRVVTPDKPVNVRTKVRLPARGSATVKLWVLNPQSDKAPDPAAGLRVTGVRVG